MTCSTFVASCSAVGRLLSPQQATRFGAPRPPRPWQHHNHPSYGVDSPQAKEVPSIALEKRRKQYFFKLLSAARNRDTRLLVSVLKSLDKETEYVRMQSNATHADPLRIQDVLLKAASRCGQTALADDFFTVRFEITGDYAVLFLHVQLIDPVVMLTLPNFLPGNVLKVWSWLSPLRYWRLLIPRAIVTLLTQGAVRCRVCWLLVSHHNYFYVDSSR